ncbi:hypothetical protein, partial [Lysobacter claricitrinus]|uniref:hypothetical protein n=1 Tax=Lysobacter claricitrinus TaxID=3367728 RepID=UPI0038B324E1
MAPPILVLIMGVVIAAPVSFLVALPFAALLRRYGRLNALYLCIAGAAVGAIVFGFYSFQSNYFTGMNDKSFALWVARQSAIKALLPGGIYGLLSALAFSIGAGITIRPSRR